MANRLSAQARELGLINPNQCRSVPPVRAFHVVSSLTHEVVIAQKMKLKVSTLFLDIQLGFDNVKPAKLTGPLRERGVSPYLVS